MPLQLHIFAILLSLLLFIPDASWAESSRAQLSSRAKPKTLSASRLQQVVVPTDAVDSIVAVVDGEPIAMSDFRTFVLSRKDTLGVNLDQANLEAIFRRGSPEGRKALESMVQERMLAREAQANGISATEEEIGMYMSEVRKQNNVDEATFESILASRGITLDRYREQVRDDIIKTRLISTKVRNKINVVDEDILKRSKGGASTLPQKGKFHLEQILLRAAEGEFELGGGADRFQEVQSRAASLRQQVETDQSLKDLDEDNYSDLGVVKPSDLRPELEKEVRKLQAGEATPVICYEAVCAIVRRVPEGEQQESQEESAPILADSEKEALRKQIFEERFQEGLENYMKQELPEKYQAELKW